MIVYDNTWARDKLMRLLFMNGRHWKLMLVITMQYPLGVPPNLRTNIDYTFILREPYIANRKEFMKILLVCFLLLKVLSSNGPVY